MALFPKVIDLAKLDGKTGFKLFSPQDGDYFGIGLSSGDVNGDGFSDIIAGAPLSNLAGERTGSTYVVFGHAGPWAKSLSVGTLDGRSGYRIDGAKVDDVTGFSVSAGDINGDGLGDTLVWAERNKASGEGQGNSIIHVVYGKAGGFKPIFDLDNLDGKSGFNVEVTPGGEAGLNVSALGDISGDGFGDFIVNTMSRHSGSHSAAVVFGRKNAPAVIDATSNSGKLDGVNGFKLVSANGHLDYVHQETAGAGDFNGDGINDIVLGARDDTTRDQLDFLDNGIERYFVVFGHQGRFAATLDYDKVGGTSGMAIQGPRDRDTMGADGYEVSYDNRVTFIGDVNGDGRDDVAFHAKAQTAYGDQTVVAYVVFGQKNGGAGVDVADLNGTNGFVVTTSDKIEAGQSMIAAAGDLNGDGIGDFSLGTGDDESGKGFVVFGKKGGLGSEVNLSAVDGTNGFAVQSPTKGGFAAPRAVGDINGDGADDTMVFTLQGGYVIFGRPSSHAPTAIKLSGKSVAENAKTGTLVGKLIATDADKGDTFTFKLLNDAGGRFVFKGNSLVVKNGLLLDYEQAKSDTVKVRVSDSQGHTLDKVLPINLKDVNPEKVSGSKKADTFVGGSKADTFMGMGGNDTLKGGGGNDRISGGTGADKLYGGDGKKGMGTDTFVFKALSDSTAKSSGQDTIYDFGKGDRFDLSALDASSKKGGNQAFSFIGTDKFDGKAGELRYEKKSSDTYVYADTNGDKKADFAFHLDDAVKLVKADFLL